MATKILFAMRVYDNTAQKMYWEDQVVEIDGPTLTRFVKNGILLGQKPKATILETDQQKLIDSMAEAQAPKKTTAKPLGKDSVLAPPADKLPETPAAAGEAH